MARVKYSVVTHARHRKVIKKAAGYYAARSTNFRTATQAVDKAQQYATRDRKNRKRNFRALWIQRINAAVRLFDIEFTYSRFINGLCFLFFCFFFYILSVYYCFGESWHRS